MNEYFAQCSSRCGKEVWISDLPSKNFAVCIWCFLSCILGTVSQMFHKRRLLKISNKKQFLLSGIQGKPRIYFNFILLLASPCGSAGKESTCNAGGQSLIPGLGRSLGEGKGYPLRYSGLENSMGCIVCGVAKSHTRLSDFHFTSLTSDTF